MDIGPASPWSDDLGFLLSSLFPQLWGASLSAPGGAATSSLIRPSLCAQQPQLLRGILGLAMTPLPRSELFEPIRPTCPYFYKYASPDRLDWLRDILLKHELYFASHPELNDRLDGWCRFSRVPIDDVIRFQTTAFINDHVRAGMPLHVLAREVVKLDLAMRQLASDPLLGEAKLRLLQSEVFKKQTERNRVYCVSMAADNEYLWDRYAANHSGYCLEFANDGIFTFAYAIDYDASLMEIDVRQPVGYQFFYRKSVTWSPEKEARIVMFPRGNPKLFAEIFKNGECPFQQFDPRLLRRVILGRNMAAGHRDQIRAWAAMRDVPVDVVDAPPCRIILLGT